MTTATIAAGTPNPALAKPRVPFSRLVRVELRKTYDTRAGMWLMIALVAVTLVAGVLFLIFAEPASDTSMLNFVGMSSFFQALLLPVMGILVVTSEWSQRTGLVTFTLEPSRIRESGGQDHGGRSFSASLQPLIAVLFSAIMTVLAGALRDGGGDWNFGPYAWLQLLVQQLFYLLAGYALGTIFLNSAAAIVVSYILPIAFSILVAFPVVQRRGAVARQEHGDAEHVDGRHARLGLVADPRHIPLVGVDSACGRRLPSRAQRDQEFLAPTAESR